MKLRILSLLLLSDCYTNIPGRVVTSTWVESSPCAGRYEVETECEASVGPWPSAAIRRDYCWTHIVRTQ